MADALAERIEACEGYAKAQGADLTETLRTGLEGVFIGIIRLHDGQTLAIDVSEGNIVRGDEVIAKLPELDVLKNRESIVAYLNESTNLQVVSID